MSGWFSILAVLVAVAALVVAWRLRRAVSQWRQLAAEAEQAMHQAQEAREQDRVAAALGDTLVDVADRLRPTVASVADDGSGDAARAALAGHCDLVREYDAAVQYCLQPVELMPGADDADLEHLLKFVDNARRRLFAARAKLMQDGALERLPGLLTAPVAAAAGERSLVDALADVAAATHGDADVDALLRDVVALTRARGTGLLQLESRIDDLPAQAAPAWLGTVLLRLLQHAVELAGEGGELVLLARSRDDHGIDVEVHAQPSRTLAAEAFGDFEQVLEDAHHRLDERGVVLEPVSLDPRSRGFVLHLPSPAAANPASAPAVATVPESVPEPTPEPTPAVAAEPAPAPTPAAEA